VWDWTCRWASSRERRAQRTAAVTIRRPDRGDPGRDEPSLTHGSTTVQRQMNLRRPDRGMRERGVGIGAFLRGHGAGLADGEDGDSEEAGKRGHVLPLAFCPLIVDWGQGLPAEEGRKGHALPFAFSLGRGIRTGKGQGWRKGSCFTLRLLASVFCHLSSALDSLPSMRSFAATPFRDHGHKRSQGPQRGARKRAAHSCQMGRRAAPRLLVIGDTLFVADSCPLINRHPPVSTNQ
jgi:hypothetical protein